jgi:sugar lactone lactonase YvrE
MKYYYANPSNQPIGPLDAAELTQLASAGVINEQTFVIAEGSQSWIPYGQIRQFIPPEDLQALHPGQPQSLSAPANPRSSRTVVIAALSAIVAVAIVAAVVLMTVRHRKNDDQGREEDVSLTSLPSAQQLYTFSTLVGTASMAGDSDGIGGAARFSAPVGAAVDWVGNVYVADTHNHTIRKITPDGIVTTLAGTAGEYGNVDGIGHAARFFSPMGLALDRAGNVYVADIGANTIRKISYGGLVTTLAGASGPAGGADGTGDLARFNGPVALAVDEAGNVYVADRGNHTIRKIAPNGEVTTLAGLAGASGSADGTGNQARFNWPTGLAVDLTGKVYVGDSGNSTIREITPDGEVTTLAGMAGVAGSADGTGAHAQFHFPNGLAVDGAGSVYVADTGNNTIRKIASGGVVTTLAGTAGVTGNADGTGVAARFSNPIGVAIDGAGSLYVADTNNDTIRKGIPASREETAQTQTTVSFPRAASGNAEELGRGILAYYPLDGSADDASGNGQNALLMNSPLFVNGVIGSAVYLRGSGQYGTNGQYVQLPSIPLKDYPAFAIALWAKIDGQTVPDGEALISFGSDSGEGAIAIMCNPSSINFTSDGYSFSTDHTPLPAECLGHWAHYALVYLCRRHQFEHDSKDQPFGRCNDHGGNGGQD